MIRTMTIAAGLVLTGCEMPTSKPDDPSPVDAVDTGASVETFDCEEPTLFYYDGDGDGFGDPALSVANCEVPAGHVVNAGDCDDIDPQVNPDAEEQCNARDDNCDGRIDEDVEPRTWFMDSDGDGYGSEADSMESCEAPDGYVSVSGDCDESRSDVNPGVSDASCDDVDNDCDGATDEDAESRTWFMDSDGDGYGSEADSMESCEAPDGYVSVSGDCDESRSDVNPGASDASCDDVDNDCDGAIDEDAESLTWFMDSDGDGYGSETESVESCTTPDGYVSVSGDCDDSLRDVNPGASDASCDDVDNDCDGAIDEDAESLRWFMDSDADGYGSDTESVESCEAPDGYVSVSGDCDESRPDVNPGASDASCDDVDNDCDGAIDEDAEKFTSYMDEDGDGVGTADTSTETCELPVGYVLAAGDCDDTDELIFPGMDERLDGKDNDCSFIVDDLSLASSDLRFDADPDEIGFGYALASGKDVTGDGTTDLLVGAHSGSSVSLFSGSLGTGDFGPGDEIELLLSEDSTARFGSSVDFVGDYDGDGWVDIVVGAPEADLGDRAGLGEVRVFLGPFAGDTVVTSAYLYNDLTLDALGATVIDAGQVTGLATNAVAASFSADSGLDGVILYDTGPLTSDSKWQAYLYGSGGFDGFGHAMGVMDRNGDGIDDLVVGAPTGVSDPDTSSGTGAVYVFDGPLSGLSQIEDSAVSIFGTDEGAELGYALSVDGDWDGDGADDLLIGSPQSDEAFIVSLDGLALGEEIESVMLARLLGPVGELGMSVALDGDVDGDGMSDALVGAPSYGGSHTESGAAALFLGGLTGTLDGEDALVTGTAAYQYAGHAVRFHSNGVGDDFSDLVIGAWGHDLDDGGSMEIDQGSAFIVQSAYSYAE